MLPLLRLLPSRLMLLPFCVVLLIINFALGYTEYSRLQLSRFQVQEALNVRAELLQKQFNQTLSAAYSLAALVQAKQADTMDLTELVAHFSELDPGLVALALAPEGIIQQQTALPDFDLYGLNLQTSPEYARLAEHAKTLHQPVGVNLAIPKQDAKLMLIMLPIFIQQEGEQATFWGFTCVVLRYAEALAMLSLPDSLDQQFDLQVRVKQKLSTVEDVVWGKHTTLTDTLTTTVITANMQWTLGVTPKQSWMSPAVLLGKVLLVFFFSVALTLWLQRSLIRAIQPQSTTAETLRLKQMLEAILHTSPILLCELDVHGQLTQIFAAEEESLSGNVKYLQTQLAAAVMPQKITDILQSAMQETQANGMVKNKRLFLSYQRVELCFEFAVITQKKNGSPYFIVMFRDITQSEKDTKHLIYSALKLRAIIENEPECVKLVSQDGRLLEMNPSGLAMIEADTLEQVTGQKVYPLVKEEYREKFKQLNEQIFKGESGNIEFEITSLKGNSRWLSSRSAPLRDIDGKIIAALSVTSNITEQKQLALERQYNEILMNITLDSGDEGILVVSKAGRILLANRRFYELWKIPKCLAMSKDDDELLSFVLEQLLEPDQFLFEVIRLYSSVEQARDILNFKDGRVYARFSRSLSINDEHARIWCFKDVTEQQTAQLALIEREAIYRSIVTQAADGILLIDPESMKSIEFNDAACIQLGYSREEFAELTIFDVQAEHDSDAVRTIVEDILLSGLGDFDTLHQHKNGSLRNVRVSARVVYVKQRHYLAVILTDITERIRVEQALRQKDRYQRALLDNFPFMIWLKNTENRFLAVNKAFIEACGVQSFGDVIGKTDLNFWPQELANRYIADDDEVKRTLGKKNLEEKISVQGHSQWLEIYKAPVLDTNDELLGTVGFARNISDRKAIEEELRLSRERLYFALKGSNDGFWDWNLETQAIYYSPRWKSMLGYADNELENTLATWKQLIEPSACDYVFNSAQYYVEGGTTEFEVEFRMRHKQGHWVDILSRAKIAEDEQGEPMFPLRLIGTHVDITERKRVSAALAESTALLNSILHNVPLRIFWKDLESRYLGCNSSFAKDAGTEIELLVGKEDTQLAWHEQAALYRADDQEVIQSQKAKLSYDEPQTTPDGKQIWLRTSKVPLRNTAQEVIGVLGVYEDITHYKQAEQDLLESETRFRKLFEYTAQATLLIESEQIIDANMAALRLLGMEEASQLINCKFTDLSPASQGGGKSSTELYTDILQLLADQNAQQLEWELNKVNGERIVTELLITPILYQRRQILHMVLRDITVRRAMEIALRQSEESLNRAQTIGNVGSWTLNFISNKFECSLETYRILGLEANQVVNFEMFVEHIYVLDRERFLSAWRDALEGKGVLDVEHRLLIDGEIRWVRERAEFEFATDNKSLAGIGTTQEITQQKLIESELEQHRFHLENLVNLRTSELEEAMQAAETANRAKSIFLSNMSHEIRTPMNAIIGLTHLLRKDIHDPKHRAQLLKIADAAQHLLAIINDVLDLSKIEAGKFSLEQIRFSLGRIVDHVLSMLSERAAVKGLLFRTEIDSRLPKLLIGDPFRLQQVLLNFVNNAVKFSHQGTITVRIKQQGEVLPDNHLMVCYEVEDQGIGLGEEQQSRLFKAFVQADDSTTRKYGGTGLGLAIVKRISDMMDGTVDVESQLGIGSRFWMTAKLGICDQTVLDTEEQGSFGTELEIENVLKNQYHGLRILVAEDDPVNQEVAKELLQDVGFIVDMVANGAQAVESVQKNAYALVLMDMQMPVMDGIAATKSIRTLSGQESLPIIAMTANAFDEDRHACLQAGMNAHVGKPVDPEKLYQTLLRWLPTLNIQKKELKKTIPNDDINDIKVLEKIPHIDIQVAQRAVQGNLNQLFNLLKIFVSAHNDDMSKLRLHINREEVDDARRLVHTIKGIAATFGALSIQQLAIELESSLQVNFHKQKALIIFNQFEQQFTQFVSDVQIAIAGMSSVNSSQEYDASQAEKKLLQLLALLEQDDTRVNGVWLESEAILKAFLGGEAKLLQQYINEFKYDQALEYLRKLLSDLVPESKV